MESKYEVHKKLSVEIRRIELDRWYEGVRVRHDPREDGYDERWISEHCDEWRERWEKSKCRTCRRAVQEKCSLDLREECIDYQSDNQFSLEKKVERNEKQ